MKLFNTQKIKYLFTFFSYFVIIWAEIFTFANSLRLTCVYVTINSIISECVVHNLTVNVNNDERVTSVSGDVTHGILNYDNITSLRLKSSPDFIYFPKGLGELFRNVEELEISDTGMKMLSDDDLRVFPKLKRLKITRNQLEHFSFEFIESNELMEAVDLSHNKLKILKLKNIKKLSHLTSIDVSGNVCIDAKANEREEVINLVYKIFENCSGEESSKEIVRFASLVSIGLLIALMFLLIIYYCLKGLF